MRRQSWRDMTIKRSPATRLQTTHPMGSDTRNAPRRARRRALSAVIALPCLCLADVAIGAQSTADGSRGALPALDSELMLEDVPLLDGRTFRPAEARGKVLVLYWWASWCPFCAIQTPMMQALWDEHRERGLALLGISIDARADDARRYLTQRRYTFPSTFRTRVVERVLPLPGKGLPVTVVRGRHGRVVMAEAGQLFPEDIARIDRFL